MAADFTGGIVHLIRLVAVQKLITVIKLMAAASFVLLLWTSVALDVGIGSRDDLKVLLARIVLAQSRALRNLPRTVLAGSRVRFI